MKIIIILLIRKMLKVIIVGVLYDIFFLVVGVGLEFMMYDEISCFKIGFLKLGEMLFFILLNLIY